MFKLARKPTFTATARIHVPGEGEGSINVEFRHFEKAARVAHFEKLAEKTNLEALSVLVCGWSGCDTPFSEEALGQLLDDYPSAAAGIFDAYFKESAGAVAKNFEGPSATG